MTQTFRRQPMFVNTPSKDAVKNYFFNHSKFKGLNDDRNFVDVDQETFQDCKNVFVDAESILRSRHAVKIKIVTWKNGSQTYELLNIIDAQEFGDTVVYNSTDGTNYYLTFVNSNFSQNVQQNLGTSNEYKLVMSEHKIFIFTATSLYYYDCDNNTVADATSFIYVPVTKVVSGGVETEFESENELTTSTITRYLFENVSTVDLLSLEGKQVTLKIGENSYIITFEDGLQYTFFVDRKNLPAESYADSYILGFDGLGTPLVDVVVHNGYTITLLCTEETTLGTASNNWVPTCNWKLYWTMNNSVYYQLPIIDGILGMPKLSLDGSLACVLRNDGIYAISLFVDNEYGTLTYSTWTKLTMSTDVSGDKQINGIDASAATNTFNQNVELNFCVKDKNTFSIVYGRSSGGASSLGTFPIHTTLIYITSVSGVETTGEVKEDVNSSAIVPALVMPLVKILDDNNTYIYMWDVLDKIRINQNGNNELYSKARPDIYRDYNNRYYNLPIRQDIKYYDGNIIFSILYKDVSDYRNPTVSHLVSIEISSKTSQAIYDGYNESSQYSTNGIITSLTCKIGDCTLTEINAIFGEIIIYNGKRFNISNIGRFDMYPLIMTTYYIVGIFFHMCNQSNGYQNDFEDYDGTIVNNDLSDQNSTIDYINEGTYNYLLPDCEAEVDNYYFSKENKLYISQFVDGGFKWYLPKINTEEFDYPITGLHPISTTELAIFQEDAIYYVQKSYNEQLQKNVYTYYKTRPGIGCIAGSDIITTFDGKYTIFASKRGLVAMSYQEFITSTEQALTYITDSIYSLFEAYNISPIKLYQHGYWIYVYRQDSNYCLVFDIRTSSWWPFMYKYNCTKFLSIDNKTHFICQTQLHSTYEGFGDYESNPQQRYEDVYYVMQNITQTTNGVTTTTRQLAELPVDIDWYVLSQKLHLGAINYYKHIVNLTLNNVIDKKQALSFIFTVKNYRTDISKDAIVSITQEGYFNNGKNEDTVSYTVDTISTFVQRVNFSKVTEFQYKLESNTKLQGSTEKRNLVALSLANITVKYKIGSQVR